MGEQMNDILPTTEYRNMEKDPIDFAVTVDSEPPGVLSDDELCLAASGGFSEKDISALTGFYHQAAKWLKVS